MWRSFPFNPLINGIHTPIRLSYCPLEILSLNPSSNNKLYGWEVEKYIFFVASPSHVRELNWVPFKLKRRQIAPSPSNNKAIIFSGSHKSIPEISKGIRSLNMKFFSSLLYIMSASTSSWIIHIYRTCVAKIYGPADIKPHYGVEIESSIITELQLRQRWKFVIGSEAALKMSDGLS